MADPETDKLPVRKTNWKRVYLLVIGWLILFSLIMLVFSKLTS